MSLHSESLAGGEWQIWMPTTPTPLHMDPYAHFRTTPREIGLVVSNVEIAGLDKVDDRTTNIQFGGDSVIGPLLLEGPFDPSMKDLYNQLKRGRHWFGSPSSREYFTNRVRANAILGTNIHYIGGETDDQLRPDLYLFTKFRKA